MDLSELSVLEGVVAGGVVGGVLFGGDILGDGSTGSEAGGNDLTGGRNVGVTVLLVEDHADTRWVMTRLLKQMGFSVKVAPDVAQAMRMAEAEKFDLLLSDIGLPDGNGYDLARDLLERGRVKQAVAISGFGQADDIERSMKAGFLVHMIKPIEFTDLKEVMRKAARMARGG